MRSQKTHAHTHTRARATIVGQGHFFFLEIQRKNSVWNSSICSKSRRQKEPESWYKTCVCAGRRRFAIYIFVIQQVPATIAAVAAAIGLRICPPKSSGAVQTGTSHGAKVVHSVPFASNNCGWSTSCSATVPHSFNTAVAPLLITKKKKKKFMSEPVHNRLHPERPLYFVICSLSPCPWWREVQRVGPLRDCQYMQCQ